MWLALYIFKGLLIRSNQTSTCTSFDRHVADRHATFHGKCANGGAAIFDDISLAAASTNLGDDRKDDIFSSYTIWQSAFNINRHSLRTNQWKSLSSKYMLNF